MNNFYRSLPMAKNKSPPIIQRHTSANHRRPLVRATWVQLVDRKWPHLWYTHHWRKWQRGKTSVYITVIFFAGLDGEPNNKNRRHTEKVPSVTALVLQPLCEANKQQISSQLNISFLSAWQVTTGINGFIEYMACMYYTVPSWKGHLNVTNHSLIQTFVAHFNHHKHFRGDISWEDSTMALTCDPPPNHHPPP